MKMDCANQAFQQLQCAANTRVPKILQSRAGFLLIQVACGMAAVVAMHSGQPVCADWITDSDCCEEQQSSVDSQWVPVGERASTNELLVDELLVDEGERVDVQDSSEAVSATTIAAEKKANPFRRASFVRNVVVSNARNTDSTEKIFLEDDAVYSSLSSESVFSEHADGLPLLELTGPNTAQGTVESRNDHENDQILRTSQIPLKLTIVKAILGALMTSAFGLTAVVCFLWRTREPQSLEG